MRVFVALLSLILIAAQPSFGQWQRNGERTEDEAARKSVKGFGAHLILVERPREFVDMWQRPETPNIETISSVKPNQPFGAFILFAGCKPNSAGVCDCEVDFDVYKPDGSLYAERKGLELWKQHAPPPQNLQLSVANLVLRMSAHDPVGKYKVKATIRDNNADVKFDVETTFTLEAD
ncbi:MAG: hypothetical protein AUG51_03835 [Acidobacteria bacterium 13_1_20CM_3_53_8]|nr:MAG: hypothetical protein AUG51_03835 [Acidobacteria bacterium 13_1_20CM_3_53_8]